MSDKIPGMDYDTDEVIENFKSKFKWPGKDEVEVAVTPPNIGMKVVLSVVLTIVLSAVYYYATFPALNFKATEAYMFVVAVIAIFIAVTKMPLAWPPSSIIWKASAIFSGEESPPTSRKLAGSPP